MAGPQRSTRLSTNVSRWRSSSRNARWSVCRISISSLVCAHSSIILFPIDSSLAEPKIETGGQRLSVNRRMTLAQSQLRLHPRAAPEYLRSSTCLLPALVEFSAHLYIDCLIAAAMKDAEAWDILRAQGYAANPDPDSAGMGVGYARGIGSPTVIVRLLPLKCAGEFFDNTS